MDDLQPIAASPELLGALDAAAEHHDVAYAGCRIRWRRWGNGPCLVLLHGGHGSWMHWVLNIQSLSSVHSVWAPDLPGFGDSDNLPLESHDPSRHQLLLEVVAGTLKQLIGPANEINLAAFSFGGLVAGQLAADHLDVRRLALLGTAGHGGPRRQNVELVDWRFPDEARKVAALRHNLGALMLSAPHRIDDLAMAVHEKSCVRTRYRSKAITHGSTLASILQPVHRPVLMVWGEHDVTTDPVQAAGRLCDGQAEREWCVLPDAGHWIQYESHHLVNQMLLRWFAVGD